MTYNMPPNYYLPKEDAPTTHNSNMRMADLMAVTEHISRKMKYKESYLNKLKLVQNISSNFQIDLTLNQLIFNCLP